jgi:hypothetical protein
VNDGLLIEEIHGGHDAILEFLFGGDANVAQVGGGGCDGLDARLPS